MNAFVSRVLRRRLVTRNIGRRRPGRRFRRLRLRTRAVGAREGHISGRKPT